MRREKQSVVEDLKVVLAVFLIFLLALAIVGVKSMSMITREDAGNVSTFKPLDQKKDSNMKNTGMGYLPCEG